MIWRALLIPNRFFAQVQLSELYPLHAAPMLGTIMPSEDWNNMHESGAGDRDRNSRKLFAHPMHWPKGRPAFGKCGD